MRWLGWTLFVLLSILGLIYATLWTLEDRCLLHPTSCPRYLAYDQASTDFIPLSSGGLLLHCRPSTNDKQSSERHEFERRTILCLHGNAGNLDGMANMARSMAELGYDVYLLEYAGYGICAGAGHPTTNSLVDDLREAWTMIPSAKRGQAILLGFSMGGGVICEFLRTAADVLDEDLPAQIALLNTFFDLPQLVRDVLPIPGVSQMMRTRWNARPGIESYCQRRHGNDRPTDTLHVNVALHGNVLVVAARDDELIPLKHADSIISTINDSFTDKALVILPNGGHNNSIQMHFALWTPYLLPPHTTNLESLFTSKSEAPVPHKLSSESFVPQQSFY